jgi:superfamily II DNA or RNA helicase
VTELNAGYGLIIADECHHVPAAAFEHAVKQIPARRWLGLTATPYRRDKLDDLIAMQVGPVRHTIALSRDALGQGTLLGAGRPTPVLYVHPTAYRYDGNADPSRPGGMTAIYRHLTADEQRTQQVIADVLAALTKDRNCLVLTNRTSHLERLADLLREAGRDPVVLRGGMGAKSAAALARLQPQPGGPPLLIAATGPYAGEGFDCPALDTLFLATPVANKGKPDPVRGPDPALA